MKIYLLCLLLILLAESVCGKNAWETTRDGILDRELEMKSLATSIIAYDKSKMTEAEVAAEVSRIEEKCVELDCPCTVTKLDKIGVLDIVWSCDNHPPVESLDLDEDLEIGSEDGIATAFDFDFPNDPKFGEQWAFQNLENNADINVIEGWEEYLSDEIGGNPEGPSVVVAVIDSGIDYNHPDLKDIMWENPGEIPGDGIDNDGNGIIDDVYGADFTAKGGPTGDPIDRNGHGTHCSGMVAGNGNNGVGIAGVASYTQGKVKLMACKGLNDRAGGTYSGLLAALNYAIANGAKISSNSWGGGSVKNQEKIWDAVLRNNLDHLVIAAAGNDNKEFHENRKWMMCGLKEPNLLCVASSDRNDKRSSFSNYGIDQVHVFAPGSGILSTIPNDGYAAWSGTSMATPIVSGLAALVLTMRPDLYAECVRDVIEKNVQPKAAYADLVSSGGLIDVGNTMKSLKSGYNCTVEEGRSCIVNESDDKDPGCAPNCCYYENEYPIEDFKLEECMNFCREREDCTRAEWKPKRRGKRSKSKCYIYSSEASETCCNADSIAMYCTPKGSKWITCSSPAN